VTRVTVVVVNYNGAHLLPDCLASLVAQTYGAGIEILVIDNGSIDESAAVAAEYPCRFIPLGANAGLPAAYNRGAALAGGEYLFFVNNDMRFDAACVARLANALDHESSLFAADPLQYNWSGDQVIHSRAMLEPARSLRETFSRALIPLPPLKMNYTVEATETIAVPWGCAGCLMVRKRLFDEIGGWDESFFIDMEDMDLCWRAWLRGWPTVFVPEARLNHRWGASNDEQLFAAKSVEIRKRLRRRDFARIVRQQRNHLRFAVKVLDPLSVCALLAIKVVALVARLPRHPAVALAMARALGAFIGDMPAGVAARRRIARTSTCTSRALIQRFRGHADDHA
jgi:GT2 family glycosyltransferase